jgi:hypothetical protein
VTRQVLAWRRSTSERRQQLKWLTGGAVLALMGLLVIAFGPPRDQPPGRIAGDFAILALAALPISMGAGILKYHLYDIDRPISRAVAYALLTGLLRKDCHAGYAGTVTLATRVLGFSSSVEVAISTLAAPPCSTPCAGGSSGRSTADSTGPGTTRRRSWRHSRNTCRAQSGPGQHGWN